MSKKQKTEWEYFKLLQIKKKYVRTFDSAKQKYHFVCQISEFPRGSRGKFDF